MFDALICVDLVLGRDAQRCSDGDLDGNGRTNIFDCLLIVDSILGRRTACGGGSALTRKVALQGGIGEATVSVGSTEGGPGGTVTIAVSLDNAVPVRAVQLRLVDVPNALTLVAGSAHSTTRSTGLVADASEQADGSVIVVLISTGSELIQPGSGSAIQLDFVIAASASLGRIELTPTDVEVSDPERNPLSTQVRAGSVQVALPTATATVTPTVAEPTRTPTPTPTRLPCAGDCNQNGVVTVDELVRAVTIVLRNGVAADCSRADVNGNGVLTIDELVKAVNAALNGCIR